MPAQKYRGKPVIIEAIQLTTSNRGEVAKWIGEADVINKSWDTKNLYIKNEHGEVIAEPTDWVIKGSRGEFYPVKDVTFKEKYEKAL